MKVKEESKKVDLKLNIQKTKIMASDLINSWQIDGETMETKTDFIFLGSKTTSYGNCSHEFKRCLLLGRKAMTNLDSLLQSRAITLPTKVYLVKAMVFPVVMYACDSWTLTQLFATLWAAACQASLSITNSRSLLKLMSIELMMPSNYLILCPQISQS